MEINYRKALPEELDDIYALVKDAIQQMESENIHQWDDIYPTKDDYLSDIENGHACVGIKDGKIAVYYAISKEYDEEYAYGEWQYEGEDFIVIHRLCVSPAFQNMGIARTTLAHIEENAKSKGVSAVKLDVFTQNPYAIKLYQNCGYNKVGTANWRKGEFLLMEKLLQQ